MQQVRDTRSGPDAGTLRTALLIAALMLATALGSIALRTALSTGARAPTIALDAGLPRSFAGWRELPNARVQVVNPQTQQLLDSLYSQIVTRTFVNDDGYAMMLSVAYGSDQRGELQAHRPEVCYPAQGFDLLAKESGQLATPFGQLDVTRLDTRMSTRREAITYWLTMGGSAANSRLDRRLQEIRMAVTGQIPDGLIFRVSSIDPDPTHAHHMQEAFVRELLVATSPELRRRLSGLEAPSTTR